VIARFVPPASDRVGREYTLSAAIDGVTVVISGGHADVDRAEPPCRKSARQRLDAGRDGLCGGVTMLRRGLILAIVVWGSVAPAAAQTIFDADFTVDPRPDWSLTGTGNGGWAAAGYLETGVGQTWRSPSFAVTGLEYVRITYRSTLGSAPTGYAGMVSTVSMNPAPTWNFDSRSPGPSGQDLIADDYRSSLATASGWAERTVYSRVQQNATAAAVRFHGGSGAPLRVDDVRVERVTDRGAVAAWSDTVWGERPRAATLAAAPPLPYAPAADRFSTLARTDARLAAGATVTMVLLGDSIVNDTANSAFDVLVERSRPGSRVNVVTAVGGGAGIDKWNPLDATYPFVSSTAANGSLRFNEAVIDQRPDVVVIGGISTPATATGYQAIRDVIDKIRSTSVLDHLGYTPDILLTTGAFGYAPWGSTVPGNPAVSGNVRGDPGLVPGSAAWNKAWCPTDQLDPFTTSEGDSRANLLRISRDMGVGFVDTMGVWGEYMILAQGGTLQSRVVDTAVYDAYFRDVVHANTFGKELLGRTLAATFAPVPEPTTIALAIGAAIVVWARSCWRRGRPASGTPQSS
jgi:hypothetical protein